MKNLYKAALVAVLGLAGVSAANAQTYGDLIAGFTTQSGTDQIVDIGNISLLYNGETWPASYLGISSASVGSYSWGIIGDATPSENVGNTSPTYDTILSTTPAIAPPAANTGTFAQVNTGIGSIIQNFSTYSSGGPNPGDTLTIPSSYDDSWNEQTINGALATQIVNSYGNPNVTGAASDFFWETTDNGAAPVELGSFSLSPAGLLTYTVTSVPEPSTYGLLAGGLMLYSVRRMFFRKQA